MKSTIFSLLVLAKYGTSSGGAWDYNHMSLWTEVSSMCSAQDESPIDVNTLTAIQDSSVCVPEFDWDINLEHSTFKAWNNGHSVVLKPAETVGAAAATSDTFTDHDGAIYQTLASNEETIAKFQNYFQPESSEHDSFCLDSLHFHWGTTDEFGSEHTVNGYQFPLEVHFVHYACSRDNLGAIFEEYPDEKAVLDGILDGDDTHTLGVVGLFFDVVDENNPAFDALFDDAVFEGIQYPEGSAHRRLGASESTVVKQFDLSSLIPDDIGSAGYYAYEGSLTTPPCTDIVRWHVMNARGYIGTSQMEKFRALMADHNTSIAPNYREIQRNVNPVYACIESDDLKEADSKETEDGLSTAWIVAIISLIVVAIIGALALYQWWQLKTLQNQIRSQDDNKRNRIKSISNEKDVAMGSGGYEPQQETGKVTNV